MRFALSNDLPVCVIAVDGADCAPFDEDQVVLVLTQHADALIEDACLDIPLGGQHERTRNCGVFCEKNDLKEIGADGSEVPLQVGAVVMLPDGFKLAPQERWTDEIKEETEGVYFTNYSEEKDNIIIVGPLPGDTNKEIVFPVLSPNPATNKEYHYGKYSLHIGGNRGRGQVYPTGDKSNNVIFTSSSAGTINSIETIEDGSYQINIENEQGEIITEAVPVGPELIVKEQDQINAGDPLTNDPNVGGFGQLDAEVVLQSPYRIIGLIAFFIGVGLTQILLVLKKKQVEKVQAAEGI